MADPQYDPEVEKEEIWAEVEKEQIWADTRRQRDQNTTAMFKAMMVAAAVIAVAGAVAALIIT